MRRKFIFWLDEWRTAERGRFTLWLPVFMGAGILSYFALRFEPPLWVGSAVAAPAACAAFCLRTRPVPRGVALAVAAAAIGFAVAEFSAVRAPPRVTLPTHATIATGVVRTVEALPEGRRIVLEAPQLDDGPSLERWLRLRLRKDDRQDVAAGDTIRIRALLRPPDPPAYPGGWDLQRDAWFSGWAGSGYALGPAELLTRPPVPAMERMVQRLRETIARHIAALVPGPTGAISITLLTGITTGIPPPDHDAFRASGLAHLLAVAGLHIGIVMGWALAFARISFAASEYASLHWPTKKLAALAALVAGGGYMVLTGMHVPIVRSFAMACLYTVAVLAGRPAVSLRGLALAACVLLEPEQVPGVSFQMSFSAVLALIVGYQALRPELRTLHGDGSWPRQFISHLAALALTSALAGIASMPFGAYHFGRIQLYFILANMIAVPLAALWAMPAGLIGLLLMPLGLDWLAFIPMGWGVSAILCVARTTAALPAATLDVPHMPPWGLAVIGLGIAWLGLWRSRLRLAAIPVIAFGLVTPLLVRPPDLLVSADARLIGVRVGHTVYLQREPGASKFTRESWLQYWAAGQALDLPRRGEVADGAISCGADTCLLRPLDHAKAAMLVRGAEHPDSCPQTSVIVSAEPARRLCPRPWPALVDRFTVWRYGATAIWLDTHRARILTDRAYRGDRPWVPPMPTRNPHPAPRLPPARPDRRSGRSAKSVTTQQPDQLALHFHPIGWKDSRLVPHVAWLECDRIAAPSEPLQRDFCIVHQSDDDLSGICRVALANNDSVAVQDAGLNHRVTSNFKSVVLAVAKHRDRHRDGIAGVLQRLDRQTCGYAAIQRYMDRLCIVGRLNAGDLRRKVTFDHGRRKCLRVLFRVGLAVASRR
jgi:competence protein ComEC